MKRSWIVGAICIALIFALGCGKNDSKSQAEKKMEQAATELEEAGEQIAKGAEGGAENLAEAMEKMGESISQMGDEAVEPIDFRELKALLPESLPNLPRQNASGEKTSAFGIKVSQAEGNYANQDDGKELNIEITDMGSVKGFIAMAGASWMMADIDRETDSGFERTMSYKGHRGYEEFDTDSNSGNIQLVVADRFMVQIDGMGMKMDEIKAALDRVDLDKLAKLGK